MYFNTPEIRMTVSNLRTNVLTGLASFYKEQDETVKLAVDKAVADFDFKAEVIKVATYELQKQIAEMVQRAVRGVLWNRENEIQELAQKAALEVLGRKP